MMRTIYFNPRPPRGGRLSGVEASRKAIPISIHAPREGGDPRGTKFKVGDIKKFQSTPPARGATITSLKSSTDTPISIHAPREGGDYLIFWVRFWILLFQSTPPARGATTEVTAMGSLLAISIHAPREGGDSKDAQFYL